MKRQKHRAKRTNTPKPNASASVGGSPDKSSRRGFLKTLRNGTLAAVVVGGGGWYLVREVSAGIRERDLSQIGNGTPTIVQIHDPQCPTCRALQRETRKALAEFDAGELQYLVADINSAEGRQLATAHGVGHVTLLLFDAEGQRRDVLVGANTSETLTLVFRRHLDEGGSS